MSAISAPAAAPPPAVAGTSPFDPRAVLAMILFGAVMFLALMWMIGAGMTGGSTNDGQAHVGSKGLTGYAALANLLEARGYPVSRARSVPMLRQRGLLVLTPPLGAKGSKIAAIIAERRAIGPTLLILPKWLAFPAQAMQGGAKEGWVQIGDARAPDWANDLDGLQLKPVEEAAGSGPVWSGLGQSGMLPDKRVQYVSAGALVPLVGDGGDHFFAAYVQDDGKYPMLASAAGAPNLGDNDSRYPLIVVAEPDLLDNWGMADEHRAMAALELVRLAQGGRMDPVSFDLTLNGYERSANLLTLAFEPPFLAATLCLLIAAVVAGWRAFRRFGPPLAEERTIAFGKGALVANAAGLVRRSGRLHLLGAPYAALLRERLARTLALPRHADPAATEAAIDRALAARDPAARPFSIIAAELRAARRPAELLRAGQALHLLERTLTR